MPSFIERLKTIAARILNRNKPKPSANTRPAELATLHEGRPVYVQYSRAEFLGLSESGVLALPHVTTLYTYDAETGNGKAAFAFCNPNDVFSRSIGRRIARKYLDKKISIEFCIESKPDMRSRQFFEYIYALDMAVALEEDLPGLTVSFTPDVKKRIVKSARPKVFYRYGLRHHILGDSMVAF